MVTCLPHVYRFLFLAPNFSSQIATCFNPGWLPTSRLHHIDKWSKLFTGKMRWRTKLWVWHVLCSQMNENYNGMMDDSPNRQNSPTNRSSTPSSRTNARTSNNTNQMNHQTNNNGSNNSHHSNNGSSPHSPLSNDSMVTGGANYDNMNCEGLRNIMGSSVLDGALLNGGGSGNGINDIMLGGGLGSDSSSKLITSSSAALQTSLMMSQTSPSHLINNTQTTTSIPEIVFSGERRFFEIEKNCSFCNQGLNVNFIPPIDYSSGSEFARDFLINDNFLELGTTELQMFENANIIDPTIEDSFRRDLY